MRLVLQEDLNGCGLACLAMVTDQTYGQVKADFTGFDNDGITEFHLWAYLSDHDYAWQWMYEYLIYKRRKTGDGTWQTQAREEWPPRLWADVHIASVRNSNGAHFVVVLRDGTVLDPAVGERRWDDYRPVANIGAIYDKVNWE